MSNVSHYHNAFNMLTIIHTEASLGWGGQEIRIYQESLELKKLGYRVLVACQEGSGIADKANRAGLKIFTFPMRFAFDLPAILKFIRIIKSEKIDIIHTHSSKDSWIAGIAGRLTGIPVVRSRHLSTPVGKNWLTTFVYRYLADVIIASGKHIKATLASRNKLNPEKIVSIAAGVDLDKFSTHIKADKIRNEFGLKRFFPIIGIVAILRSWKGHQYFLEAIPKVVSIYPDARFLIVGDGPTRNTIQQKIIEDGIEKYVIMTGFRNDIPEIMAVLDVFVLPSYASEATSQVIPQALAMSKPIVATNVGGLPEIIEDSVTGLLVPPKNPEAISNAIIWMIKHPDKAKEMAMEGRNKILKCFTFQGMIEQTTEVYESVLGKKQIKNHE